MQIGTNIKRLRRERDMTQEDLAEYMNVSVSAVSQWELGKTMPDISMIPSLCALFRVSADELLDIDISRREAEIEELLDRAYEQGKYGDFNGELLTLREAITRFPDSYKVMTRIIAANYIPCDHNFSADEIARMCEKIVDGCTNDEYRHYAIERLVYYYARKGDIERAEEMLSKLSYVNQSRESVRIQMYNGDKRIEAMRDYIYGALLQNLETAMKFNFKNDAGEWIYTEDDMAKSYEKILALLALFFEDGDYGFFFDRAENAHVELARCHARKGNDDIALSHIESAADAAIKFDDFMNAGEYVHTSQYFRGYTCLSAGIYMGTSDNFSATMLSDLSDSVFNALRSDPRFTAVTDKLTANSAPWKREE